MKPITEHLKNELYNSHTGASFTHFKWSNVFDTEEELIEAMFHEKIYMDEDEIPMYMWCRGYGYIKSFRNYYRKHGRLTDKQITQLKRIAYEIAYRIYCC